ncbi:unnamed protein product [Larinioides sclopetarius]|uniref:Uncharacterized protein n=1 Tax=Larinioides sclopetarius TaxID=280406 RepID=A0AAV1ZXZ0_9ARAC
MRLFGVIKVPFVSTVSFGDMSLEEAESQSDIPLHFGLISTLKSKDLRSLRGCYFSADDVFYDYIETLRSDVYKFRNIEELSFCLELNWSYDSKYERKMYQVNVKSSKGWSILVKYAFCIVGNRPLFVKRTGRLKFILPLESWYLKSDEPEVKLYCAMSATRVQQCPPIRGEDLPLTGQRLVEFETLPTLQDLDYCKNEVVSRFVQSGEIPHFTLDLAIQLFNESDEQKCDALTLLSKQYLMAKVTSENYQKLKKALPKRFLSKLMSVLLWKQKSKSKIDFSKRIFVHPF